MLRSNLRSTRSTFHRLGRRSLTADPKQAAILRKYPIGLNIHGYEIEDVKAIPEFSLVAVKLLHSKTGSEHLHLDPSNDKNNVFSVAFKTNPPDATGVPHILEHTTLCGSYKFPVKDPFFKMLNRSLSNFMNAMTGHDYTFYPFATTNAKDFENLMDVYLSSVFEPLLTYEDFTQEGWRLENSETQKKESDIIFKGVVYNEMKGQYSNSAYYYWIKFQEAIYSSLNNSGGDPLKITSLQYEDLVDFHSTNYHPSNAKTFTYGPLPLSNHLKKLNSAFEFFGKRTKKTDVKHSIFKDKDYISEISVKGPVDSMSGQPADEQYKASVTWNLGNPLDTEKQYEIFKWKILSSLLCDGHSSPFYQELIEKEYGDDFSVNTGLDTTTSLLSFTIGLNNMSKESSNNLENVILKIFNENVIPQLSDKNSSFGNRVDAILHQIELSFKKHKPDFGLGLLNSIVPSWVNGLDPMSTLNVDQILNRFKHDYETQGLQLFSRLLEESILNPETKKFKFTMVPDIDFNKNLADEENKRLQEIVGNLSEDDKEVIYNRGISLSEKQQKEEDVSVLPTLTIKDIPRQGDFYPLSFTDIGNQTLQKRLVDTNGLIYASALKDISFLPTKYYKYLPLFSACLTNLAGTDKTSITDLETKIQKLTGGISFNFSAKTDPLDISRANLNFGISGMSLRNKSECIYDLWYEILNGTKFNHEDEQVVDKLSTLIKNLGQNQSNYIADKGHSYASAISNSKLTPTKYISNLLSGIEQVEFVLELNANLEKKGKDYLIESVLPILAEIQKILNQNGQFKYSLVGSSEIVNENEKLIKQFDNKFTNSSENLTNSLSSLLNSFNNNTLGLNKRQNNLINLPFRVGYASLAKSGSHYTSKDGASLQVLSQLLTFKHLHSIIRESNGAYGGGLNYDGLGGTLNYYSYRDPNPLNSVKSFLDSFEVALNKSEVWDAKDLQEAKLAIFQSIDAPSHIASQGSSNFFEGITDSMKQERRENFLDVNNQDLRDVAEKYLVNNKENIITVIGDNNLLDVKVDDPEWAIKTLKT